MEEIVDGQTAECLGFTYNEDESDAAIFALKLFSEQLMAGNIIENPQEDDSAVELLKLVEELRLEFEAGLHTVAPHQHAALAKIFFPYVSNMHRAVPMSRYETHCNTLGVTPFELFSNALTAEAVMRESDIAITMMPADD